MCNLARSNLATGLYQEGFLGPGDFPLLHERCLGNNSGGGARSQSDVTKEYVPSPHGGFAGKSTADRSPNFEEYHRVLHCKNSIHIPKSRYQIDCTLTYCASNECHHHGRKERRWEKASHGSAFGVSRLQFPPECFLPCPTLTQSLSKRSLLKSFPPSSLVPLALFPEKKWHVTCARNTSKWQQGSSKAATRWTH